MEELLFKKLQLDKNLCLVTQPNWLSRDVRNAFGYVNDLLDKADNDLHDMANSTKNIKQIIYLFHPETMQSHLEIITTIRPYQDKLRKKRYISLGTNENLDLFNLPEIDNRPKNTNKAIPLKRGQSKNILLYLSIKGMIFKAVSETFDND